MTGTDPVAVFDGRAAEYDRWYDDDGQAGDWLRARLQVVLGLVGDGPGTILDVGAGSGRLLLELEQRGWTVWGVDGSSAMLALAHARVPAASGRLLEARAEDLPFGDGTFDVVTTVGVLGWARDRAAVAAEVARVLRPGGRAVVTIGNARSPLVRWRHDVVYPAAQRIKRHARVGRPAPPLKAQLPDRKELVAMLAGAGLEVERLEYACCSVLPDPLDRAFPRTAAAWARAANRLPPRLRSVPAGQRVIAARKASLPDRETTRPGLSDP